MNAQPFIQGNSDINQLRSFIHINGIKSLYIEWVPDEMSEEMATSYFNYYGKVSRIDFVKQKTGNARMLFVHFSEYPVELFEAIINQYPQVLDMSIMIRDVAMREKIYKLKTRINLTPIKPVEYNNTQLTDMVDRLRLEVEELKSQIAILVKMNGELLASK